MLEEVKITAVTIPGDSGLRARELGLQEGAPVLVVQRSLRGVVVKAGQQKIALDRASARGIQVHVPTS